MQGINIYQISTKTNIQYAVYSTNTLFRSRLKKELDKMR